MRNILFKVISSFVLLLPTPVLAQVNTIVPSDNFGLPGGRGSTFGGEISRYVRLFLVIVGLIAVVFLIYGGFKYIMSAGDSEAAESAKNTIVNAIIGLVVIILSYVIVAVVTNALLGRVST